MRTNPILNTDFYKVSHSQQYPPGLTRVVSNFTPRRSRIPGVDRVVFVGLSYYLQRYLHQAFVEWFSMDLKEAVDEPCGRIQATGLEPDRARWVDLHNHGELPIEIWALPEGTHAPIGVPVLQMWNTHPQFAWLVNYLETSLSATLWGPCTSATRAMQYRAILGKSARQTGLPRDFIDVQAHDFSFRGMLGCEAAALSGLGHLVFFKGTDNIPALELARQYYGEPCAGGSVPATEHSVMCMGGQGGERETFRRLIEDVHPHGIVSIVSDTWDYWNVLENILPSLRESILARDGKVVVRPDSGDPVKIICGEPYAERLAARKGTFRMLAETFGTTQTETGHLRLNDKVGVIYGDAITPERAREICERLQLQDFAPDCVFGVGSYTYQYNTRDTFGFAMKATAGKIGETEIDVFKAPVTDTGEKRSARGVVLPYRDHTGRLQMRDGLRLHEFVSHRGNAMKPVFCEGPTLAQPSLRDIRQRAMEGLGLPL